MLVDRITGMHIVARSGQCDQRAAIQFREVQQDHSSTMNMNLTIKNLKRIPLPFQSFSGHSSCNKTAECCQGTASP